MGACRTLAARVLSRGRSSLRRRDGADQYRGAFSGESLARDASETVDGTVETDTNAMLGIVPEAAPVEAAPEVVQKVCYAKQRSGGVLVDTDVVIPCKN